MTAKNIVKNAVKAATESVSSATKKNAPGFYEKLANYFPSEEMKNPEHMEALLKDKPHLYKVDESDDHVLVYSDHKDFQAIDYVWVNSKTRGKGVGKKLIEKLKKNGKPIFLEVEQVDESDPDSKKRLSFYDREGFRHARSLSYIRETLDGEKMPLEVLYWTPDGKEMSDEQVLSVMKEWYDEIHRHKDEEIYGQPLASSQKVVQTREKKKDILEQV